MKNHLLLVPAEWMLVSEVSQSIDETRGPVMEALRKSGSHTPEEYSVFKHINEPFPGVFTMPFFSDKWCQMVVDEMKNAKNKGKFKPNEEEEEHLRIDEFVLSKHAPGWYGSMWQLIHGKMNPVFGALWAKLVNEGIIQVANYNPRGHQHTGWHHDGTADITVVVPLNTGEYKGGGTAFLNTGKQTIRNEYDNVLPPLPNGHALIFPTFSTLHKGMPVESGDRLLFVFWLKANPTKQ